MTIYNGRADVFFLFLIVKWYEYLFHFIHQFETDSRMQREGRQLDAVSMQYPNQEEQLYLHGTARDGE